MLRKIFIASLLFSSLLGCGTETVYAPVSEISPIERIPSHGIYQVQSEDTLYSIAWRYGLDFRYLAKLNNIAKPYHIDAGQKLYLRPMKQVKKPLPIQRVSVAEKQIETAPTARVTAWIWPVRGAIVTPFTPLNKGLNIAGTKNEAVLAAAPGVVVYSGNGLKAYGNLIIIKHNSEFLSAYAYNYKIFVKEGDWVKQGQRIAVLGPVFSRKTMLHFEIRRNGKPINPLNYLPTQTAQLVNRPQIMRE